ncbi:dipeptidase PepE [Maribacter polysaccharolyticus]|uniref:dipeptidase PepE n=1 Tax=Maribacter polysaccharolyticus TaxID=3020831 RepID=UPI00237F3F38|nr:dipeptidase PepE [Maribacter polysaccharolyticus]MDE3743725.1 dipeptidase PepE [Maribacter polysaccharolyticus]
MVNCLLASTSNLYGGTYLSYLFDRLAALFQSTEEIIFIPYARPGGISHDAYTELAASAFGKIGKKVVGLHTFDDPKAALETAQGLFTGGGNSFVLVNDLYHLDLMTPLRQAILNGTPYLGTSAGSNIAGPTVKTTNDMPIVYPPSFDSLGIIPFNINPHYLDPDPTSTHKGETRETRIKEFHQFNNTPVIGLREGSWIRVQNEETTLQGAQLNARIFEKGKEAYEIPEGTSLKFLG